MIRLSALSLTVLSQLQLLESKGHVIHARDGGACRYRVVAPAREAGETVLGRVLDRLYQNSPSRNNERARRTAAFVLIVHLRRVGQNRLFCSSQNWPRRHPANRPDGGASNSPVGLYDLLGAGRDWSFQKHIAFP